uniref:Uncharacterized protein n=1 Tax=Bird gammacoronavirus AnasCN24 TaxID=3237959 RepID=A0AB39AEZ2_9GAMC
MAPKKFFVRCYRRIRSLFRSRNSSSKIEDYLLGSSLTVSCFNEICFCMQPECSVCNVTCDCCGGCGDWLCKTCNYIPLNNFDADAYILKHQQSMINLVLQL